MMDTSKQYIEMCRQAREIQKRWELQDGDYYVWPRQSELIKVWLYSIFTICKDNYTWLPRQDQLQDIIGGTWDKPLMRLANKYSHQEPFDLPPPDGVQSMEQLWLAFVMEEKYNKQWKDGAWTPISGQHILSSSD